MKYEFMCNLCRGIYYCAHGKHKEICKLCKDKDKQHKNSD